MKQKCFISPSFSDAFISALVLPIPASPGLTVQGFYFPSCQGKNVLSFTHSSAPSVIYSDGCCTIEDCFRRGNGFPLQVASFPNVYFDVFGRFLRAEVFKGTLVTAVWPGLSLSAEDSQLVSHVSVKYFMLILKYSDASTCKPP